MFLTCHSSFRLARVAVIYVILDRISGLNPSSDVMALRYLKFFNYLSLLPFTLISDTSGFLVLTFVFSVPISIL